MRTETVGFSGTNVIVDTEYDTFGRLKRQSRPYYAGGTALWQSRTYDLLDRLLTETAADGSVTTYTYAGYTTTVTNPKNQNTTRLVNSQGQLLRVTDHLGAFTTYTYDPFGNLTATTDPAGNTVTMSYDLRGNKTGMVDPDMGAWSYQYNALGELVSQTDALGQTLTLAYDLLGRMVSRTEAEGTTSWTYDSAPGKGIGQLASVSGPNGLSESYSYDLQGRPSTTSRTVDFTPYVTTTSYDTAGRVATIAYPSGQLTVQQVYNSFGYLAELRNAATGAPFWQADAYQADGQLTQATYGNGLVNTRSYSATTGLLDTVTTGPIGNRVQKLKYTWDSLGNLTEREDTERDLQDKFTYDSLNRLIKAKYAGNGPNFTQTYSYDSTGNLLTKSNVGSYSYGFGPAGPHAVTSANGVSYSYDPNGNMTSGDGRSLTWTSYNLPSTISKGSASHTLVYGPDRSRYKQIKVVGGVTTTIRYLGDLYETSDQAGVTEQRHYLFAGGERIAIHKTYSNGTTPVTQYLHHDHLPDMRTPTCYEAYASCKIVWARPTSSPMTPALYWSECRLHPLASAESP